MSPELLPALLVLVAMALALAMRFLTSRRLDTFLSAPSMRPHLPRK